MPSTPGMALDVITGTIPITLWLEEESAKGILRLKNLNHCQHPPSGKLSMRLISHITTNEKLLKSISEVRVPHDQKTPSLSIDQGFAVNIPNRDVFSEPIESEYDVNCYTDVSKINEQVGAGIVVKSSPSKGGAALAKEALITTKPSTWINTTQSFRLKCLPWEKQPLSS